MAPSQGNLRADVLDENVEALLMRDQRHTPDSTRCSSPAPPHAASAAN